MLYAMHGHFVNHISWCSQYPGPGLGGPEFVYFTGPYTWQLEYRWPLRGALPPVCYTKCVTQAYVAGKRHDEAYVIALAKAFIW